MTTGIRLRGVGKTYGEGDRATQALTPVDLDIASGEFVAIVGPSGCGKSTLLRIITGLIPRTGGELTVFGKAVTGPVTEVGIVFQQPILLEWRNVLENVLFQVDMRGLDTEAYRPKALRLLKSVGLADFADRRPYELSGGMKQRAAIARGLVHEPPLLMMDEPFGALDALTREQMRLDLERLWMETRKTIVFITHSIDEAVLLADRVVVMSPRPGRIETILPIDLPRPRGLGARKDPRFSEACDKITEIFLERGVLHREARDPRRSMSAAAFADRINMARREGALLDAGVEPMTRGEAFEAQRLICEGLGERVAGWKIADHPTLGMIGAPIFAGDTRADGAAWPLTPGLGVEIEIALWLARDVPRGRHTRGDVIAAIAGWRLGVELVGSRLAEPQRNLFAFLGDRMANVGYVHGPGASPWREMIVAGRRCTFRIDGETVHDAPAAPPALDPIAVTMAWLERADDALGGLRAGQFVTTGSVCGVLPAARAGAATAAIEGLGEVTFALT